LQEIPETQNIPVVVCSADASPSHIERILAQGVKYYLTKPIHVSQFLEVLDEILKDDPTKS
jgi:CheY-like chemotaxis protein